MSSNYNSTVGLIDLETESESNRTFPVRVRFGSIEFLKCRFEFGSVRLNFQKVGSGSVRFGSTHFLKCRFEFGSVRLEPF